MLFAMIIATGLNCGAAWGNDGHKVIAQVASGLLSSAERAKVQKLVGASSLADIATWADQVRHEAKYRWSAPLHFVNNPDGTCTFDYSKACKNDFCAVGAILNFTNIAMSSGSSQDAVNDALRFVVHFMGDLHQPLHCAWTSDLGGNKIDVEEGFEDDKKTNLHAVWDTGIIDRTEKDGAFDWTGYEAALAKDLPSDSCFDSSSQAKLKDCVMQIAQESLTLACNYAYKDETAKLITDGEDLDDKYYTTRKPVVDSQLQKAGVRLAAVLKFIMGQGPIAV